MDIVAQNRIAWNKAAKAGNRWATPHSPETFEAARKGDFEINLVGEKKVPTEWLGQLKEKKVLCLAAGGGQQAPLLAAAGASVVSFDNSDEQLASDMAVADRHSLDLRVVQGDVADLSVFGNETFDLIFHPVSNHCVPDVKPVWNECFRVLRWNGRLLSGFLNPALFLFDPTAEGSESLRVNYPLPFSDLINLPPETLERFIQNGASIEFGHTLEDLIGGQIASGFIICGLQEGHHDGGDGALPFDRYCSRYIGTLAKKVRIEQLGRIDMR